MTDEELRDNVRSLCERVEDLENEAEALKQIPSAVAELKGALGTLQDLVISRLDGVQTSVERSNSVKAAITFASVVIVPILVALIGGYFVLRAGGH